MSSYYNKITGTLKTGHTARADDIHLIQSSIQNAIKNIIIDMFGSGFILGQSENALKLYGTNIHTDQSNLEYTPDSCWISFYDTYLKQPITITKSSIETIKVQMRNNTVDTSVTVYAEIRDENLNLIQETNATLGITSDQGVDVCFDFNKDHLEIGKYYFIIRPVDVSATDHVNHKEGVYYDETIQYDQFCVRYDVDGHYSQGLEASIDGKNYLQAKYLSNNIQVGGEVSVDMSKGNNHDLYFEEIFSSGNTYLIDDRFAAIVLGEKVYPHDTHVTIAPPDDKGNRIDLVSLTKDGQLEVTSGKVYTDNEEKDIPTNPVGLKVAYITNYKASLKKVPSIDQNDTNHITRNRDILERLRRIEKRLDYQDSNNAPARIQYNCTIDPILKNDETDNEPEIRGEGTYGVTTSTDENGEIVVTGETVIHYAWSIIKDNYSYEVEGETTENGKLKVWDVFTTPTQDNNYTTAINGLYRYHVEATDESDDESKPISGLKLIVQIKKSGELIRSETLTTNTNGVANYNLFGLQLPVGKYNVRTIYGNQYVDSTITVTNKLTTRQGSSTYKESTHEKTLTLPKASKTILTHKLPEGVIPGNDSFFTENVDVDIEKGEVSIKKISSSTDEYETNGGRPLLKNTSGYESQEEIHLIKKEKENSDFPALHVTFDREAYIKSVTPYIAGFKNIESFGILIFKNDIIHNVTDTRETYKKIIGSEDVKKDSYDDPTFPTLYKSEQKSLKDVVKESGDYKVPKEPVTFDDIDLDIEAGTYTIMICPKIESGKEEGEIKIKKYATKKDSIIYGTDEKIYGSSKLSAVYISTTDAHDTSWDIAIKHKTYRYYDEGTLISKPINTGNDFSACAISKNFIIPKNCDIILSVSNNGGTTWEQATTNYVTFQNENSSFKWKLEMKSNNIATPKLKYNENKENAISFTLVTSTSFVEYEDFHRCYETPIMNANTITRQYTKSRTTNTFSQWEFARVFMEDDELNSRIDILISYAENDFSTTVQTNKIQWYDTIFFSTIFADLTLDDFSQESIDYDNYEGNVEYDEHNFKFSLNTNDIMHYTGGLALASPEKSFNNNDGECYYGDISYGSSINKIFKYSLVSLKDSPYEYYDNYGDSKNVYAGMHISAGPYVKATYTPENNTNAIYSEDDPIIGVRFNNGLKIDENITHLNIGIVVGNKTATTATTTATTDTTTSTTTTATTTPKFPAGTFKIVLSLGRYGEKDAQGYSSGKEYIIDKDLYENKYNEISISFIDDLEGYKVSGINSIAIKKVDKKDGEGNSIPDTNPFAANDFIGLGRITTSSYNMRPYSPYPYASWERLQWQKCDIIKDDPKAQAWGIVNVQGWADGDSDQILYPIDDVEDSKDSKTRTIISINEQTGGIRINKNENDTNGLQLWRRHETNRRKLRHVELSENGNYIKRQENQIDIKFGDTEYKGITDSGSQTVFQCPKGVTGDLYKLEINIPLTIYDLIDIEYYMFTQYWDIEEDGENAPQQINNSGNYNVQKHGNRIYKTDGSFSKGELYFDFYDTTEIDDAEPIISCALPSWGRIATSAKQENKLINAWFKKRTSHTTAKMIILRRENPRKLPKDEIRDIKLVLNDIIFLNGEMEAALGPQMQMRIYPNNYNALNNTKIRKIGGVYRL